MIISETFSSELSINVGNIERVYSESIALDAARDSVAICTGVESDRGSCCA